MLRIKDSFQKTQSEILIITASILLGIWAVNGTIAIRNILLILGLTLSICKIFNWISINKKKEFKIIEFLPLLLSLSFFFWIYIGILLNGQMYLDGLKEYSGTWLRSICAYIFGCGVALSVMNSREKFSILLLGMLASFLVLFLQYIPMAIQVKSFYYVNHYGNYFIYSGKVNAVLVGTIMISGYVSILLSSLFFIPRLSKNIKIIAVIGIIITLYIYVFIVNSRMGLLLIFSIIIILIIMALYFRESTLGLFLLNSHFKKILVLLLLLMGYFTIGEHLSRNPSWYYIFEDVKIAVDIEHNHNWRDPLVLGYPLNSHGKQVSSNTYERVAWFVAGIKLFLVKNWAGSGRLEGNFPRLIEDMYGGEVKYIPSTHSGWLELALSTGVIGAILLAGSFVSVIYLSMIKNSQAIMTGMMALTILLLYLVSELSTGHALEILLFWNGFLGAKVMLMRSSIRHK